MMHVRPLFLSRRSGVAFSFAGLLTALLMGVFPQVGEAQSGPSLRSVQQPVRIAIDPVYQRYESVDGQVLTEASTRLTAQVPITTRLTVEARAGIARMDGQNLTRVQGLTDATGRVTYAQPVGEGSVVFSASVNAPVGKQRLDEEALSTTRLISQNYYDFRVTSFSRGLSVSPQMTWAYPVTDRFAVGIGAGYQHQRGFQPNAQLSADSLYVPGDGVGVNAGMDYKITESSAIGLDVAFKQYNPDRLDGVQQFNAGRRVAGTLRYLQRSGFTTIRGVLRYANWEESAFAYQLREGPKRGQVIPPHAMALASYQTRVQEGVRFSVRVSGHRYAETIQDGPQGDAKTVGRVYVSPSFDIGEALTLVPHGQVTYGSYLGLGGGLRIEGTF